MVHARITPMQEDGGVRADCHKCGRISRDDRLQEPTVGQLIRIPRFFPHKHMPKAIDEYGTVTKVEDGTIYYKDRRGTPTEISYDSTHWHVVDKFPPDLSDVVSILTGQITTEFNNIHPKYHLGSEYRSRTKTIAFNIECPKETPSAEIAESTRFTLEHESNPPVCYIYVNDLTMQRCGSGTAVLAHIKLFADFINGHPLVMCNLVNFIELYDGSEITDPGVCKKDSGVDAGVNLAKFSVWSKGISWYNSMGFVGPCHSEEVEHNRRVIVLPLASLLAEITKHAKNPTSIPDDVKTLLDEWVEEKSTIAEFFLQIKQSLKRIPTDCTLLKKVESLLDLLPPTWGRKRTMSPFEEGLKIKYDHRLLLYFPRAPALQQEPYSILAPSSRRSLRRSRSRCRGR